VDDYLILLLDRQIMMNVSQVFDEKDVLSRVFYDVLLSIPKQKYGLSVIVSSVDGEIDLQPAV
jgi:hypothetical protein